MITWIRLSRATPSVLSLALVVAAAGCGALDVTDPTRIEEQDLENGTGADLLRKDVLHALATAAGTGVLNSGMLADEFFWDPNPLVATAPEELLDRRASDPYEERVTARVSGYLTWHQVRLAVGLALPRLRSHVPEPARSAYLSQMAAVHGYVSLLLAEHFCPGFPLHKVVDDRLVYGAPLTTGEAFEFALADFDSAVALAADSARFLHFAQVGRARTLLGLGRFAEAAGAAAAVPTDYIWNAEFATAASAGPTHSLSFRLLTNTRRSVADREGGTGLDFSSADDRRVEVTHRGVSNDGVTELWGMAKYPTDASPIALASGLEARLIEAEAAMRAGSPHWLEILNDLRASQISPGLGVLEDPGSETARVDLLFRERAFWLFATGHRLGDLRRLVEHYGRPPETVFPTGEYRFGGTYDTGTSIPFPASEEAAYSPAVTGCTNR